MNAVTPRTMHALKSTLEDACDTVRVGSRDAAYATLRQVRRHPLAAITLAAAAGALLALFVRRH